MKKLLLVIMLIANLFAFDNANASTGEDTIETVNSEEFEGEEGTMPNIEQAYELAMYNKLAMLDCGAGNKSPLELYYKYLITLNESPSPYMEKNFVESECVVRWNKYVESKLTQLDTKFITPKTKIFYTRVISFKVESINFISEFENNRYEHRLAGIFIIDGKKVAINNLLGLEKKIVLEIKKIIEVIGVPYDPTFKKFPKEFKVYVYSQSDSLLGDLTNSGETINTVCADDLCSSNPIIWK